MNLLERNVRYMTEHDGKYGSYGITPEKMRDYLGYSDIKDYYAFIQGDRIAVRSQLEMLVRSLKAIGVNVGARKLLTESLDVERDLWGKPIYYDHCPEGDFSKEEEDKVEDVFDCFIRAMRVLGR